MRKKLLAVAAMFFALLENLSATGYTALAAKSSSGSSSSSSSGGSACSASYIIMIVLMLVIMYFMLIRPQKKKEKETKNLQDSVQIGDEVVTIGGIVGLVIKVGDDNVVIETGGDKHKIRIKKWAVQENITLKEKADAEAAKKKADKANGKITFGKSKEDKEKDKKKSEEKKD